MSGRHEHLSDEKKARIILKLQNTDLSFKVLGGLFGVDPATIRKINLSAGIRPIKKIKK
ncbi:hypothetical protein H0W91_03810 [Patescibacteria group bacterium]|nr:hypothetical protein [Patescibacteria group bacterium]